MKSLTFYIHAELNALGVAAKWAIGARGDSDGTRGSVRTENWLVLVATYEELLAGLAHNAAKGPVGLGRVAAHLTRSSSSNAAGGAARRRFSIVCNVAVVVVVAFAGDAVFVFDLAHLTVENGHVLHWDLQQ